jgi:uncharacterized protein (DUF4415 family)
MALIHQIRKIGEAKPKKQRPAEKIVEGLKEALAVAKGEAKPHKVHRPKRASELEASGDSQRRGRPATGKARRQISIRLDADIVSHFETKGEGWRSLINDALRKHIETN